MRKFALYKGEVWEVIREDHFEDLDYRLLESLEYVKKSDKKIRVVHFSQCTPLDPALNILFERKDNE